MMFYRSNWNYLGERRFVPLPSLSSLLEEQFPEEDPGMTWSYKKIPVMQLLID